MVRSQLKTVLPALAAMLCVASAAAAQEPAPGSAAFAPTVGQMAPDFTLEDQEGRKRTLSAERGKPVVLVFYRGHW